MAMAHVDPALLPSTLPMPGTQLSLGRPVPRDWPTWRRYRSGIAKPTVWDTEKAGSTVSLGGRVSGAPREPAKAWPNPDGLTGAQA